MDFFKRINNKHVLVSLLMISLIVLFQEEIFNFFENSINLSWLKIFTAFSDDSFKWTDDFFRLINKSRKGLAAIFSCLTGYLFYKSRNHKD
tara:strand:+ start:803 stop:1075 length:273 start_codon:yes stop_codon:yes gene_type:complete